MNKNKILIYLLLIINLVFIISILHKMASNGLFQRGEDGPAYRIKISVLNGCGEPGLARRFADFFQNNNFEIVYVGNADSNDYNETTLINHNKIPPKSVDRLQKMLGIDKNRVITVPGESTIGDVKLILGKDFKELTVYKKYLLGP